MSFLNLINSQISTVSKSLFSNTVSTAKRTAIIGRWKPYPEKKAPRANRENRALRSKKIVELVREAIANDEPHFHVGKKEIIFPSARVCLLRPNANHTPYQAKFIVPKSFNKMDLRDYLYNIYGLRVNNITVALTPGKFDHSLSPPYGTRFRSPQIKKMTVELMEPFVWPEIPQHFKDDIEFAEQMRKYADDKQGATNSDEAKPSKAFGGIIDPNPRAMNFVPKRVRRVMVNNVEKAKIGYKKASKAEYISKHLGI